MTDTQTKPKWEEYARDLHRIAVPGGWLYRYDFGTELTFVPEPKPDCASGVNLHHGFYQLGPYGPYFGPGGHGY